MAEYSPSAATRLALINAAGILFAEYGIDAVTTREIANAAHENTGTIHYHFGGKEDLLNAVLEFAAEPWRDDPLGRHLKENSHLLETTDGQFKLVEDLVELAFDTMFSKEYPAWCKTLVFQILQKELKVSEHVFKACAKPLAGVFASLYSKITNDDDPGNAIAWAMMALSPAILQAITPTTTKRFFKGGKLPSNYLESLKSFSKVGAIAALHCRGRKQTES
jgi:TetR/AcrR family transcriptional regulator, regulator of cefoperazone and chloramphenicol sensitivity